MYDRLTPLGRNITDAMLQPSADGSGLLQVGQAARRRRPVADHRRDGQQRRALGAHPARRVRRPARLLRHRRRRHLRRRLRRRRGPQPADRADARQRDRGCDRDPRRLGDHLARDLYTYKPTAAVRAEVERRQTAALRRAGAEGRQVLRDIDTYLVGINLWYRQQPAGGPAGRSRGHLRDQRDQGPVPRGGRGRRDQQRAAARRRARQVRRPARQRGLRGPARPQRPRDADHRRRSGAVGDRRPGRPATRPGPARAGDVQDPGARAPGRGRERDGPPAAGGLERAAGLRRALRHGRAAVRGRPADLLQLPGPDAGDGPLRPEHPRARRDVGSVPRLHADRARGRTSPGR